MVAVGRNGSALLVHRGCRVRERASTERTVSVWLSGLTDAGHSGDQGGRRQINIGGAKNVCRGGVPINFFEEEGGKIACQNILEGGKVPGFFYPNSRPNFGLTQSNFALTQPIFALNRPNFPLNSKFDEKWSTFLL